VIQALNVALLATLLVGMPVVTGVRFGELRLSSAVWLERLVLGGLALGVSANVAARWISGNRKERGILFGWAIVHGSLLAVGFMAFVGWIDFVWLKQWLMGIRSWMGGR
jgi:hypothetical protein